MKTKSKAAKTQEPKTKSSKPEATAKNSAVAQASLKSVFKFSHHTLALGTKPDGSIARFVSVGELVLNDPSSRNSFRVETAKELAKFLPQIEKTCDALVFRAEGRVFCSGGNLKDHIAQGAAKGKAANRTIATTLTKLSTLKIPTIAMVEGDALGGGIELLSVFDMVMCAPHVVFGFWQRRLGLAFGWGGGARLLRRLGSATALTRLALEARAIPAVEAKSCGLVDVVVPTWSLRQEAMAEALRMASLPRASVAAMKQSRIIPASEARAEQTAFEKLWFGVAHRGFLDARAERK